MSRDDTVFLKFVAISLVLNSHLDAYYPVAHIGTGGAIGNVLFFVLSSFGLLLSEKRSPQTFIGYAAKRVKRIYPSVWLVLLFIDIPIQMLDQAGETNGMIKLLKDCLFPPFWFLKGLLIYYIIGFFVIKNYSRRKVLITIGIAFAVYLYGYFNYIDLSSWSVEKLPFKYSFYLIVFLFGIFLAEFNTKITYSGKKDVIIFIGAVFILYGHKLLMAKQILPSFQIVQQLILFAIVFYAIKLSRSSFVLEGIMQVPALRKPISYISAMTLELYIVHTTISAFTLDQYPSFPINVIVFLVASFSIAALVKWVSTKMLQFIDSKKLVEST